MFFLVKDKKLLIKCSCISVNKENLDDWFAGKLGSMGDFKKRTES